jgi:hypothetical protein
MEQNIIKSEIESRIFTMRGKQVMLDRDLAEFFGTTTKRLNEQVKRNVARFPDNFLFQLNNLEKNELVANCDRFRILKHSSAFPFAFYRLWNCYDRNNPKVGDCCTDEYSHHKFIHSIPKENLFGTCYD